MNTAHRIAHGMAAQMNAVLGHVGLRLERTSASADSSQFSSTEYWEGRYSDGGNSGAGSYGRLAEFKAEVLHGICREHGIQSVIEWGCGDGHQSSLLQVPDYLGVDVSETSVRRCQMEHGSPGRRYETVDTYLAGSSEPKDCSISLDVIYHLVEDRVYHEYMKNLFACSAGVVVAYSSNNVPAGRWPKHIRHRPFTSWVTANEPGWELVRFIPNRYPFEIDSPDETSFADFFVFEKTSAIAGT